ncbi:piezo-type mechanosensitive ion channel component 1-like [Acanthaster planci]|uniref:Piezo-type mechanosensitive ion channel component 1-like n=1 Tax=Acanthaster planci TaxID=133434 RepID=A0A8B7XJM1_ACAPL|nr:piezo-type mechanosensitive ion channel component 1-like [Acanthaster planci]
MANTAKGKYAKLHPDVALADLSSADEASDEVDVMNLTSKPAKGSRTSLTDPSMDISGGSDKLANHKPGDQSYDVYDRARPVRAAHHEPDQLSAHDTTTMTSGMSLSELPFRDLWRNAKLSIKLAWSKSLQGVSRWGQETKAWILSRYFVTWLLFYFLVGPVVLTASLLRYNALSGAYLLCLLVLPLMPNPSRRNMSGRTGIYLIILLILSALACLTQAVFQIVLAADSPYGHDWEACNGTEPIWRQLGYQRLNELSGGSVCRLILPDVVVLLVTIIVFAVCKKLFAPRNPADETQQPTEADGSPAVVERRTRPKSVVVEGLQSFLAMLLCAFAAVIYPSVTSGLYFVTFLLVITWWSLYKSWGQRFYHVCIVWLLYSGAHIFALYLYQFPFFQEGLAPEDLFARLFGLRAIINATECDEPREIVFVGGQPWFVYVNPGAVLIFYFYLAILIRCWLDGPTRKMHINGNAKSQQHEVVRRPKKQRKQHGEKEVSPQRQRLMDESGPSYQSMEPTDAAAASGSREGAEEGAELQRQVSTRSEEDGQRKMSPFATMVAYVTKQCYIGALILMMVWSITYHSWLTFVLLLWSLLIWIIPASTTRNRALYSSPLLVIYCEGLLLIQFVYGLDLNDSELPSVTKDGINLAEIGLMKFMYPCGPLALQLLYTVMLWLTLRQFLRERRLAKLSVNSEGIVLQPFGVIFSNPDEEMQAIEDAREGGDFPDRGDSETMSVIGNTVLGIFSKYWILLVMAMFLIVTIQHSVDIFKIIYMGLFLLIANMFLWSFTLFRGLVWIFLWLVVLYSIAVLVMIYTYQFEDFPGYWTNGTGISLKVLEDLGLREYDVSELFLNLLIPTAFIIIVMVYLHYFHSKFMDITKIEQSGYKPSKIKEEDVEGEVGAAGEEGGDETDRASHISKKDKTHSQLKLYVKYISIICKTYYDRAAAILWRCLEIHMSKVVLFTIIMVVTREMTAANGLLVLLIFLVMPLPWFTRCMFLLAALWVSIVIFVKMVFQLDLMPMERFATNCTDNEAINGTFSYLEWFGLRQTNSFPAYIIGYVFIILMMILWYAAQLRQEHYRNINNLERPKQKIVFEEVKREQADEGLVNCMKFLANYCFYKYGLEMCYITTVIVAAVRLDVLSVIYMVLLLCLIFLRRKTVSYLWPFYTILLLCLLLLTYALSLGLPPMFCFADFFQLLFVCLQLHVFRIEKNRGPAYGGGDNYEAFVDIENIAENPVPNFTFSRSYLDTAKTLVFEYLFWVTLAVTFLAGTTRVSLFGLIYIVFSFYFLWLGSEYLIKPTRVVIKRWNKLLLYNLLVIFLKVCLQIMSCVYVKQLLNAKCCWLLQLLGVVCLQSDFNIGDIEAAREENKCTLPVDDAGLSWDVAVFIFLLIQKRIFTSNYFQYVVISLEEQKSLASKGAELINELLATRVRNKRLEEKRILEGIKKKMSRIQKQQLDLMHKAQRREPKYHDEAVRGQGGYYMFKDVSDEELSDLEPDAIPGGEGDEGKHSAFHLVHDAVAMSPEDALKKDDKAKGEEDIDTGETSGAADAEKKKGDDKKDGPLDIEEAEDVLAEIEELEKDAEEEQKGGICTKFLNILKLIWRVLMRGLEGCIHFFDEISEEYRYVAQELDKLSSEGKRQRALKRKAKAIKPAEDVGGEEIEEVTPREPARVSIKVEDADGGAGDVEGLSQGDETDAVAKAETASTAETTSSEKFVRTMPRPIRFIFSLLYAVVSQSQLVCYFLIILNLLLSANLLSLPLPILVFTWAMLSVPRPTKRFWITVITYTELVVILKYFFQFYFYPWNTDDEITLNASNPLWWPVILGINHKDAYAVLDLCILLAAFFHRSILRRHGLWQESQVVPNLEDPDGQEQLAITSGDASADDADSKKKRKKKKKKSKADKEAEKSETATEEVKEPPGEEAATAEGGGDEAKGETDAEESSEEEEEKHKTSIFTPFVSFFHNMLDPTYTVVTDVYVPMLLCDVFNFILFAIFSYSFGEEQSQSDVAELITSNSIPLFFVLFLLLQFILMVIDRAIYLRKAVVAKFIFLILVIVGVHVWMFFLLPKINNRRFTENVPAQIWYFVKCVYFGLSAYQIRCGYPTRILGNCLCKRYNYLNLFLFYGYQAIPFLKEIRMLMDWMFTNTTLSLTHWVEVEDVYSSVYTTKCWRNAEKNYPVDRGRLKSKLVKYGAGGIQLLLLIIIVWFPLLLISLSNTSSIANPPSEIDISISISGYSPLFETTARDTALRTITQKEYNDLLDRFSGDLDAVTFFKNYRAEDVVEVTISGASTTSWDVSPPSRKSLEETLLSKTSNIDFRYSYAVKRTSDSSLVTPTVDGYYQISLSPNKPPGKMIRKELATQLNTNTTATAMVPRVYPSYLRVPAKGNAEPATKLLESPTVNGYSSITMKLESGPIANVGGEREWWVVNQGNGSMVIYTLNDRVASDLFAPLAGYGVIGLYVSLVLVVGKFVRMIFSGVATKIMFNELPNVDRIVKLCLDIFLVRECGEMALEEDLTAKLIFLYRSPAMLIEFTRYKRD